MYLRDMCQLGRWHASVYQASCSGGLVVQKTCHPFSTIALDHAHEQCNTMVKEDGSEVGLASTPGALRRWPQIARLLKSCFEHSMTSKSADSEGNQKQSPALQKAFKRNVEALVSFEEARKSI